MLAVVVDQDVGALRELPGEDAPGERVLDLCAGAGGKSLAIAAAVPGAHILATDSNRARLGKLGPRAERAGAAIETRLLNSPREIEELSDWRDKADLVLDICRRTGATRYLSGRTGASYLAASDFAQSGIEVVVQSFGVPVYERRRPLPEDVGGLSALDAWLEVGDECRNLLGEDT